MCGPKSLIPQTGYWDFNYACDNPWATPPESCDAYEGQQGGKAINDVAYPNGGEWQKLFVAAHYMMLPLTDTFSKLCKSRLAGRTDVEGCCWWGRGVIQTSGVW